MGCDYYTEINDGSGTIEFIFITIDKNNRKQKETIEIEIPEGGKLYVDEIKDENIWTR